MTQDSAEHLLAALQRSGLFGHEQLDEARRELVPSFPHAAALGEYLVEIDWLTAFQLQYLLAGEWDEVVLGPYQLLDKVGEGGVCRVYRAWDTAGGRFVALKVLHPHLAERADAVASFKGESRAISLMTHPNVIKAFASGEDEGRHFYAMEFVEGMDLERFVQTAGPLPIDHACDYVRQAAQGLQAAHQIGLVHRDVKPANLFLVNPPLPPATASPRRAPLDPVVKVIDWGLARTAAEGPAPGEVKGQLLGTADYMAPEQIQDSSLVDIRADVYSLGCTLHYLLTGQPPFPGGSVMQKILQHQEAAPPSLAHARPDVPDELDALVRRMLAKRPEDRPQIPLLLVTPLRKIALACAGRPVAGVAGPPRPGSSTVIPRPTLLNLPRPATSINLPLPRRDP